MVVQIRCQPFAVCPARYSVLADFFHIKKYFEFRSYLHENRDDVQSLLLHRQQIVKKRFSAQLDINLFRYYSHSFEF